MAINIDSLVSCMQSPPQLRKAGLQHTNAANQSNITDVHDCNCLHPPIRVTGLTQAQSRHLITADAGNNSGKVAAAGNDICASSSASMQDLPACCNSK